MTLPANVIDARFSTYQPPPPHHGGTLGGSLPLPNLDPEPTKFGINEIIIEIDTETHSSYQRIHQDPFDQHMYERKTEIVRTGNGPVIFQPIDEPLRSRLDVRRVQYLSRNIVDAIGDSDLHPRGQAIALDMQAKTGRILDLLDTDDGRTLWRKLRRIAFSLPDKQAFLLENPKPPKVYQLDAYSVWQWAFYMRLIINDGCATRGPRKCREVQNVSDLPTIAQCAQSRKCKPVFAHVGLEMQMKQDCNLRAQLMEGGAARYAFTGVLNEGLLGLDPEADFRTYMVDPRLK